MRARPTQGKEVSPLLVRLARRWAVGVVAAVVLLAGGIGVWMLLDRGGSDDRVHATGPVGDSTRPVLEWAEFDPGLDDDAVSGLLASLGDGRILMQTYRPGSDKAGPGLQLLVTEDGADWSEVPIPTGLWPPQFDLSSERWLVAGHDIAGDPRSANGESEGGDSRGLAGYRAFYSDDQGASWIELEFDFSSSSIQVPPTYDIFPYVVTVALASGDHMVIVLQSNEEDASAASDSGSEMSSHLGEEPGERSKARIFASDGGVLEQVAEYDGLIYNSIVINRNVSTAAGFSIQLYVRGDTEQAPGRLSTLTSTDGRTWSQSEGAGSLFPQALGPDGSLWRSAWLGTGYGLNRFDREGSLTIEVAFDNAIPFLLAAGPSGVAVNAMAIPGTELFTLPNQRIAKDGYELRFNEPEGGFTLWDLAADTAVYECGPEVLWVRWAPSKADCRLRYPNDDSAEMDAEVIVFQDMETGVDLVSFTRGELVPEFPLWAITGLVVDSPKEEEQWLGWSADGIEWSWQTPAGAFGIDPGEANDASVSLAVGDGFVLARVEQIDNSPPYSLSTRWFIAQVP
ncbi:MAG: hypothetical protein F4153_01180 [Acidimicrobiia bacterium]|nr:hypothetical protein [Acidimicrobiia bacterium]